MVFLFQSVTNAPRPRENETIGGTRDKFLSHLDNFQIRVNEEGGLVNYFRRKLTDYYGEKMSIPEVKKAVESLLSFIEEYEKKNGPGALLSNFRGAIEGGEVLFYSLEAWQRHPLEQTAANNDQLTEARFLNLFGAWIGTCRVLEMYHEVNPNPKLHLDIPSLTEGQTTSSHLDLEHGTIQVGYQFGSIDVISLFLGAVGTGAHETTHFCGGNEFAATLLQRAFGLRIIPKDIIKADAILPENDEQEQTPEQKLHAERLNMAIDEIPANGHLYLMFLYTVSQRNTEDMFKLLDPENQNRLIGDNGKPVDVSLLGMEYAAVFFGPMIASILELETPEKGIDTEKLMKAVTDLLDPKYAGHTFLSVFDIYVMLKYNELPSDYNGGLAKYTAEYILEPYDLDKDKKFVDAFTSALEKVKKDLDGGMGLHDFVPKLYQYVKEALGNVKEFHDAIKRVEPSKAASEGLVYTQSINGFWAA